MRIVGFAQTMRLGTTAEEGYVLTIQLDDGTESTVPTSQDTVMALTKLWAKNNRGYKAQPKADIPKVEPQPFMPSPPVEEEDEDEGEVFGGNAIASVSMDEAGYPVVHTAPAPAMPRPRFLETDDEDGQQV